MNYLKETLSFFYILFSFLISRGLRFENVELLVSALEEEMKAMKFSWIDSKGTICEQTGTFRVNCMDCLDRTNVVQVISFFCLFKVFILGVFLI